ncbi:MAG: nitrilase-related carbon-nitrogen hydrolase [bacterium]
MKKNLLLLFASSLFWMLFIGKWSVAIATWVCLALWLRSSLKLKLWEFILFGFPLFAITGFIASYGMIGSKLLAIGVVLVITLIYFIPLVINKLLYKYQNSFVWTLLFPALFTLADFVAFKLNPFGSWTSIAYSQYGNTALLQSLSIFGISGLTFIIAWSGSVINYLWDKNFDLKNISKIWLIYPTILFLIFLFGGLRILSTNNSPSVRVASIGVDDTIVGNDDKTVENLFDLTAKESAAGAKIVLWAEANGRITESQEEANMQRAANIAKKENIYLFSSWWISLTDSNSKLAKNKVVGFNPKGEKVLDYLKTNPIPGEPIMKGNGQIQTVETEFGKIAVAICFDNDFPGLITQVGRANVDILLSPSRDWSAIDPKHSQNLSYRAIENGVSMVKQTNLGYSMAFDSKGRTINQMDYNNTSQRVMVTQLPTKGEPVIYPYIEYLTIVVSAFIVVGLSLTTRRKRQKL